MGKRRITAAEFYEWIIDTSARLYVGGTTSITKEARQQMVEVV